MRTSLLRAGVTLAIALVGCLVSCSYDPHPKDGTMTCAPGSRPCPIGYACFSGTYWDKNHMPNGSGGSGVDGANPVDGGFSLDGPSSSGGGLGTGGGVASDGGIGAGGSIVPDGGVGRLSLKSR